MGDLLIVNFGDLMCTVCPLTLKYGYFAGLIFAGCQLLVKIGPLEISYHNIVFLVLSEVCWYRGDN